MQLEGLLNNTQSSQSRLEAEVEEVSSELKEAEKQISLLQEQLKEQRKLSEKYVRVVGVMVFR